MRRSTFLIALLVLAVAATPAAAQQQRERDSLLWATVNICDSGQSPQRLGIRASMPGTGRRREQLYMRFRAQWFSPVQGGWTNFQSEALNPDFVNVGSSRFRARQSGWTFEFRLDPGQRFRLRGVVTFEWRRGGRVVRREVRRTRSGHRTAVAEPRGFSAATCMIQA
jgi:hypothetical protein